MLGRDIVSTPLPHGPSDTLDGFRCVLRSPRSKFGSRHTEVSGTYYDTDRPKNFVDTKVHYSRTEKSRQETGPRTRDQSWWAVGHSEKKPSRTVKLLTTDERS